MKIFVAGGTGVVGTRALPALVTAGHEVAAVARTEAKADLVRSLGGAPVTVDLFDADAVRAVVVGHEVVVNLATSIPPLAKAARRSAWATNERLRSEASNHLVDGALAAGAGWYIQESIAFPYLDHGDQWIDEDHPVDHVGPFAGARDAEAAAARFAKGGGAGVVLRYAQFYAPDSTHTKAANATVRRRINPFLGGPGGYTSFLHAEDAGSAVVAALRALSGTYNVGDDEPLTRAEAGEVVAEALGVKPPHPLPKVVRAVSPASAKLLMKSLRVSNGRFKAATGWSPAHPSIRGSWPTETSS
ncbi:MAG: NAD(P)-dependent oxidoreductase [Acidimicrobiales bacterium]